MERVRATAPFVEAVDEGVGDRRVAATLGLTDGSVEPRRPALLPGGNVFRVLEDMMMLKMVL